MNEGLLIVDKPSGITSHDVVSFVRRKFKMKQVGHAGTLDPLATGVLVILLGKSTKLFNKFSLFDKAYDATVRLGVRTDTADIEGKVLMTADCENVTKEQVAEVLEKFIGEIEQTPPMFSAVKYKGQKLYNLARKGVSVDRLSRKVRINSLRLMDFSLPQVTLSMDCSKGTYVRTLAEDVGNILGCGGCISQIRRTKVGPFTINDAVKLEDINESHIRRWQN